MKLGRYMVYFDNWASPIFINAYKFNNVAKRARKLFPVCDCGCGEQTTIKSVKRIN